MNTLHYIQHVAYETPGSILDWAKENGVRVSSTRLYEDDSFPDLSMFDSLVIMGGPMGVYDENKFGWLNREKRFVEKAIKAKKNILGICLGAQLLAEVLGAPVRKNGHREIGWFPIMTTKENKGVATTGFLPESLTAFHWHGETFDLPSGSIRIALSEACGNQGFVLDERIVGLQFHLEVTEKSLDEMVRNGRHELAPDKYVQDGQTILSNRNSIKTDNDYMSIMLNNLSGDPEEIDPASM